MLTHHGTHRFPPFFFMIGGEVLGQDSDCSCQLLGTLPARTLSAPDVDFRSGKDIGRLWEIARFDRSLSHNEVLVVAAP